MGMLVSVYDHLNEVLALVNLLRIIHVFTCTER